MESIKRLFGAQDMTVGSPMRNLLKFSVPLLIGNIAQQLYSTADSIIVGNAVGDNALAAVGTSMPVLNLLLVLFMAIATGASIMVSQYFGAKDRKMLSDTVGTSLVLVVLSSLLITAVGLLLTKWILNLISVPEALYQMAYDYLTILLIGLIFTALFNIVSGILRGLGDSVWPLVFLLVAVTLNVALDLWFVFGLSMGVAGAAWATIISQAVSACLCLIRLFKMRDIVDLGRHNLRPDKHLSLQLARLGLPAGATQGIMSISMLLVQRLTNMMGPTVVATSIAVMRVDGFAMLPNFTFGMALSTFVGQNVGARRMDRVERGSRDGLVLALAVACTLSLSLILFGRYLVGWFTKTELIIQLGTHAFRVLALGYIAMGAWQVYTGIMRGAGDTMPAMWISLGVNVAVRIPAAYLLAYLTRSDEWPNGSPDALFFSLVICWVSGALVTYLWYRQGKWKHKSLIPAKDEAKIPAIEEM